MTADNIDTREASARLYEGRYPIYRGGAECPHVPDLVGHVRGRETFTGQALEDLKEHLRLCRFCARQVEIAARRFSRPLPADFTPPETVLEEPGGRKKVEKSPLQVEDSPSGGRAEETWAPTASETRPGRPRGLRESQARRDFETIYPPLIVELARKRLPEADAQELARSIHRKVVEALRSREYDPATGSFRGWLFAILRREFVSFAGSQLSPELLSNLPGREEFDREFARQTMCWAGEQVSAEFDRDTWLAFRRTEIEEQSLKDTAAELGISLAEVVRRTGEVVTRINEMIEQNTIE